MDGRPALAFGGSDPALGLSLLESEWQSLAAVDGIAPVAVDSADDADSQITFAELGGLAVGLALVAYRYTLAPKTKETVA